MKTHFLSAIITIAGVFSMSSCGDDKMTNKDAMGVEEVAKHQLLFGPKMDSIGSGDQNFNLIGDHKLKKGTYYLRGWVYITEGSSLTIEPGTIIKGDKNTKAALIAEKGGKLIADGTAKDPIVFTSAQPKGQRKPGDWGGIILCGKAKTNTQGLQIEGGPRSEYGGTDDKDNSGILRYVRCEFGGHPFRIDQEINGVTLAAVGSGTTIENVQVSYCNDDSFEFFGGTVNAKNLIAYHGWDDDFDTDFGYSGKLQYLLAIKNPKIADKSLSNSFESDNNPKGLASDLFTSCTFSNVTIVGPSVQAADFKNVSTYINAEGLKPNNTSTLGTFQAAVQIRRSSRMNLFNSVAFGFPVGLMVDNQRGSSQTWALEGKLNVKHNIFASMNILGSDINNKQEDRLSSDGVMFDSADLKKVSFSNTFFNKAENGNTHVASVDALKLNKAKNTWAPMAGSPLLGKAKFDNPMLSGLQAVSYVGAFASDSDKDDWTKDWTSFDPQNENY